MAAAKPPKALLISKLIDQLKTAFANTAELPRLDFVESVIFAILRENRSTSEAMTALARLKADYESDFNELRVSGLGEIARKIGPVPDAEARARGIRNFLHAVFDKNYKFQIEGLNKKPFKEIRDELKNYEALGIDHHLAYVQVQCLGGHAFPVDARLLEAAKRLGIVEKSADAANLRGLLEKNIPKAQILHAIALAERFVNEICTHDTPRCKDCVFQKNCPYYLEQSQPSKPVIKDKPKSKAPSTNGKPAPAAEPAPAAKQAAEKPAASVSTKAAPAKAAAAKAETRKASTPTAEAGQPVAKKASPAKSPKPARATEPSPKPAAESVVGKSAERKPEAVKNIPAEKAKAKATAPKPGDSKPPKAAKPAAKPKQSPGESAPKDHSASSAIKKTPDKPPAGVPKKRKS